MKRTKVSFFTTREDIYFSQEPIKDNGLEDWLGYAWSAVYHLWTILISICIHSICFRVYSAKTRLFKDFSIMAAKSVAHTTVQLAGGFFEV